MALGTDALTSSGTGKFDDDADTVRRRWAERTRNISRFVAHQAEGASSSLAGTGALDLRRWASAVLGAGSVRDLVDIVSPCAYGCDGQQGRSHGFALSLSNLDPRVQYGFKPPTVEFRLPRASTDPKVVLFWMAFIQLLVAEAEHRSVAAVSALASGRLDTNRMVRSFGIKARAVAATAPEIQKHGSIIELFAMLTKRHAHDNTMGVFAEKLAGGYRKED